MSFLVTLARGIDRSNPPTWTFRLSPPSLSDHFFSSFPFHPSLDCPLLCIRNLLLNSPTILQSCSLFLKISSCIQFLSFFIPLASDLKNPSQKTISIQYFITDVFIRLLSNIDSKNWIYIVISFFQSMHIALIKLHIIILMVVRLQWYFRFFFNNLDCFSFAI